MKSNAVCMYKYLFERFREKIVLEKIFFVRAVSNLSCSLQLTNTCVCVLSFCRVLHVWAVWVYFWNLVFSVNLNIRVVLDRTCNSIFRNEYAVYI